MEKYIRVLGKRGRITIPHEIRMQMGFGYNDVLSFAISEDGQEVTLHREKLCDGCKNIPQQQPQSVVLEEFLTDLSSEQKMAAFIFLAKSVMTTQSTNLQSRV